jgi:hypothetical protein
MEAQACRVAKTSFERTADLFRFLNSIFKAMPMRARTIQNNLEQGTNMRLNERIPAFGRREEAVRTVIKAKTKQKRQYRLIFMIFKR